MRATKYRTKLTDEDICSLEQMTRAHSTPQNQARRARIILLANQKGLSNKAIAEQLGTDSATVTKWTKRWFEQSGSSVTKRLSDAPRSGAPASITAEQWCQIMALACEKPEDYGRPITHWSYSELADEVIKQGIVEHIATSYLFTFLKKQTCNPIEVVTG